MSRHLALGALWLALVAAPGAVPAALAASAPAFEAAQPGYRFQFPRDHAAHPRYRTEWWYYTGQLQAADGRAFGYQLTFFRVGVPAGQPLGPRASRWRAADVHLAHFAISDVAGQSFRFAERLQRGGVGLAWALTPRYEVVNGTWRAALEGDRHHLTARAGGEAIDLALTPSKPPVVHGHDGISRKSGCATCASHYYSYTRLATQGTLTLAGAPVGVTGQSWMDHEFGSNQLGGDEQGWDWFSVQLDDGSELMLYLLRRVDGQPVPESSGTWVDARGQGRHLPRSSFTIAQTARWTSPHSQADYPAGWSIAVPSADLQLDVTPVLADQELRAQGSAGEVYWEGAVRVSGRRGGKPITGKGYVELTGYAGRFRAHI